MTYRRPKLGFTLLILLAIVALFVGQHYWGHVVSAKQVSAPTDMPREARFNPASTKLIRGEARGEWAACHYDLNQQADLCRLTNQRGIVVFEGRFLPAGKSTPLPDAQLQLASYDPVHHWVPGPIEGFPVPVLPLQNGALLVPAEDAKELAARWKSNPAELEAIKR